MHLLFPIFKCWHALVRKMMIWFYYLFLYIGRLALLAFVGICVQQSAYPGTGPLENLASHLADPWHNNIGDVIIPRSIVPWKSNLYHTIPCKTPCKHLCHYDNFVVIKVRINLLYKFLLWMKAEKWSSSLVDASSRHK